MVVRNINIYYFRKNVNRNISLSQIQCWTYKQYNPNTTTVSCVSQFFLATTRSRNWTPAWTEMMRLLVTDWQFHKNYFYGFLEIQSDLETFLTGNLKTATSFAWKTFLAGSKGGAKTITEKILRAQILPHRAGALQYG